MNSKPIQVSIKRKEERKVLSTFCSSLQELSESSFQNNNFLSFQGAWHDGKGFAIRTASLEFESGRALLVQTLDNYGFTRSLKPKKCIFRG